MILTKLKELLGNIPEDLNNGFRHRMRIHQGWWRMAVLGEDEGEHPQNPKDTVCNTINDGNPKRNFLTNNSYDSFLRTKEERKVHSVGLFEEKRLLNNLLSSQPLCFNFFGELKMDTEFAASVLKIWIPTVLEVDWVKFEYAPKANYSNDGSAFDIAIRYKTIKNTFGLLGLECKYTDDFSTKGDPKKREYQNIYKMNTHIFTKEYESYLQPKYVQLFRNQMIGQSLLNYEGYSEINYNGYSEVYTGLFCHHDDKAALGTGRQFQNMLNNGENNFKIITYQDFINELQRMNLTWKQREWTMKLWARYCGMGLSDKLFNEVKKSDEF